MTDARSMADSTGEGQYRAAATAAQSAMPVPPAAGKVPMLRAAAPGHRAGVI